MTVQPAEASRGSSTGSFFWTVQPAERSTGAWTVQPAERSTGPWTVQPAERSTGAWTVQPADILAIGLESEDWKEEVECELNVVGWRRKSVWLARLARLL